MQQSLRLTGFILLFIVTVAFGAVNARHSQFRDAYQYVCEMVALKFYEETPELIQWKKRCDQQVDDLPVFIRKQTVIRYMQSTLSEIPVSHLMIYNPQEEEFLWKGKAVDTGIRVRMIDGQFIVSEVIPGSVAAKVEVKPGDVIQTLNGQSIQSLAEVQSGKGLFQFERLGKKYEAILQPTSLQVDSSPEVQNLGNGFVRLKISSFRSEYFDDKQWLQIVEQLKPFNRIIVDLRENAGGNFVAMLRALSPFFCEPTLVGNVESPRKASDKLPAFEDNLEDSYQIESMDKHSEIGLRTFGTYGCLKQPVTVLTDSGTSSVSEIFAASIRLRKNSVVWGSATRGDVVLAIWYSMPFLGNGYSLSIPEARVMTAKGEFLEGRGVWPDRDLFYLREEAEQGRDSFLLRAVSAYKQKSLD